VEVAVTNSIGGAFVLHPGQGRKIDLGGFEMSVKATGAQTGEAFAFLEATEPAGFGPPMHRHTDASESFYVLHGEYTVFLGEQEYTCPAGSFIFIPAGTPHGFRVGPMPSRKIMVFAPAAMVGYFDDLSNAVRGGTVAPDELAAIAAAHSMEVLGPVPEGYV
jgi:quercetin dioxygenase-like cupin family protein